jgi:hypothetical protein
MSIDLSTLQHFDSVHWLFSSGRITHEQFMRERHRRYTEGLSITFVHAWDPNYATVTELQEARRIGRIDEATHTRANELRTAKPNLMERIKERVALSSMSPFKRAGRHGYEDK